MSPARTDSAEATERLGAELGMSLDPGDIVVVTGDLGTGKTTFVRGACRALGVTEPVVSPTFTIGRRYRGDVPISHLDLYRLRGMSDEEPGLLDDYLTPDAIAFVEWPGVAEGELERVRARVLIEHAGGDEREVTIDLTPASRD